MNWRSTNGRVGSRRRSRVESKECRRKGWSSPLPVSFRADLIHLPAGERTLRGVPRVDKHLGKKMWGKKSELSRARLHLLPAIFLPPGWSAERADARRRRAAEEKPRMDTMKHEFQSKPAPLLTSQVAGSRASSQIRFQEIVRRRKMQDLPQIQKGHRCKARNPTICGLSESAGGQNQEPGPIPWQRNRWQGNKSSNRQSFWQKYGG